MNDVTSQTTRVEAEPKPKTKPGDGKFIGTYPAEPYPTKSIAELLGPGKGRANLNFPDVHNDYELDNALVGQTVTSNGCIVQSNWLPGPVIPAGDGWSTSSYIKPIAAYLAYIKKDTVPSGVQESYSLTKKKGFTRQFTTSASVTSSVSAGIFGCEASLEVTTGFSYSETINEETTETWTRTLTGPQDYWTFQPVIVYAHRVAKGLFDRDSNWARLPRYVSGNIGFVFVPVFRNTPSVIDREIGYLSLNDVVSYLSNEAWGRW
jgi:hypothetical protein